MLSVQNYIYPCSDGHLLMILLKSTIPLGSIYLQKTVPEYELSLKKKKRSHPLWHYKQFWEPTILRTWTKVWWLASHSLETAWNYSRAAWTTSFISAFVLTCSFVIYLRTIGQTLSCARAPLSAVWRWVIRKSLQLSPVSWALLASARFLLVARQSYVRP